MVDSKSPPPRPVVICGPSGVGKGTLIELLQKHFPDNKFGFSVSHTTRKPREGEENGVHYNFSTVETMKKEIEAGKFVEYAEVHGNYYGTSVKSVESVQNQNLICLLDIDIQGAQNVKKSTLDARYLFVAPPSMEELEKRLRGRGTESEEAMQRRLANAQGEMDYGMGEGNFDAVLVNNDLDETLKEMVGKFEGWFPELLGGGDGGGGEGEGDDGAKSGPPQAANKNGASEEKIPPPIVDPLSFPMTDEGLSALLSEIDKDCPLEGYMKSDLTYHASNVYIAAGKKIQIPLPPVEQDGSKIEWNITVVDPYNERLDIEFGLFVIVDGEEVAAREMGRIVSPVLKSAGNKDDDATVSSNGDDDDDNNKNVSAKGKFTVANSAPVMVIIKLDNSYSWIKPKKINYSFNITSPVDNNMIERSQRAKSVVPKIMEGQKALAEAKAEETSRAEALGRIQLEMEEKMSGLKKQIDDGKKSAEALQKRADEAEEEAKVKANEIMEALSVVKKEEQSIEECTSAIIELEEECARLRRKWEELKVERQVREEEKQEKEQEAERKKEKRIQLQEEIAAKKAEEQSTLAEVESVEKERSLLEDNLKDLGKEKEAKEAEEARYAEEMKFLDKQLNAVKLRFIEPKKSS
mmetsp:Transcript_33980/g.62577  ORF Transcript_33980/g.62577 Transcript_33980/m.62577 type:complete len:636 (+) Transcript_33980:126-2033(+)|eukprot:CAMPEP_0196139490 /NCGR_PEP_ID=MMETSP0910-20130528/6747_1 /TAXON_ID=49265 /ORGANISM="Thalassiosira rotula, Strain GSO102" /LENGTH=635 /DNA_ID=CAMNT_0041400219 /DNA_START=119 /DNA_END=2026 /DNA_ORIENTATION=-